MLGNHRLLCSVGGCIKAGPDDINPIELRFNNDALGPTLPADAVVGQHNLEMLFDFSTIGIPSHLAADDLLALEFSVPETGQLRPFT